MKMPEQGNVRHWRLTRRQAMGVTAGGVVYIQGMLMPSEANADGEDKASADTGGGDTHGPSEYSDERYRSIQNENDRSLANYTGVSALMNAEARVPVFSSNLSILQETATGSYRDQSGKADASVGALSGGNFNRRLLSNGETPLENYVLGRQSSLPEGVTVSVGRDLVFRLGRPGSTPLWVLPTLDISKQGVGGSVTVGLGTSYWLFLTRSYTARDTSVSIGAFTASKAGLGILISVNVSDLIKQERELTIDAAVLAPYPARTNLFNAVEVGVETKPIEETYQILYNVLGPLSDYRTFQDPLSTMFSP